MGGDSESGRFDDLESMLQDPCAQPCDLRLQYLREITNDFSSERELGRGGFGVVYKGVLPNGEMIAVKNLVLMPQHHEKQFKNEVDNLMRVRHQNIVRFVGYCSEAWMKYIEYNGTHVFAERSNRLLCFEYMSSGSLDRYISEECCGLDWHKRYKIIKGICYGLHYLHVECQINAALIHLDLKPANILLDDNMVPKIADFGLSKLFIDQKTQTYATTLAGSRGYMAPEYICNGIITTKADIYSLGVIIIEVITGCHIDPFTSCCDFLEPVLKNWRNRLEAEQRYTSLEMDFQQIETCLEIGLCCIKANRLERPEIGQIIRRLNTCESTDCYASDEERPLVDKIIKSDPKELLEITPRKLRFCLETNKRISCVVKLTNKTDDYVAFYFGIIMAKNNYSIEPTSGFLWPQSPCNVVVTMEERQEIPLLDWQCTDEFLVQSAVVGKYILTSKTITVDMFNKMASNLVNKIKLTVVHVPPDQRLLPRIEDMMVDLLRVQLRREMDKEGIPEVNIRSKVHDILSRIYNTEPEPLQLHVQPDLHPLEDFSKDNQELHIAILLFSEISGSSKPDMESKLFDLIEGLQNAGSFEDGDDDSDHVDHEADEFIRRFYEQLRQEETKHLPLYDTGSSEIVRPFPVAGVHPVDEPPVQLHELPTDCAYLHTDSPIIEIINRLQATGEDQMDEPTLHSQLLGTDCVPETEMLACDQPINNPNPSTIVLNETIHRIQAAVTDQMGEPTLQSRLRRECVNEIKACDPPVSNLNNPSAVTTRETIPDGTLPTTVKLRITDKIRGRLRGLLPKRLHK